MSRGNLELAQVWAGGEILSLDLGSNREVPEGGVTLGACAVLGVEGALDQAGLCPEEGGPLQEEAAAPPRQLVSSLLHWGFLESGGGRQ